MRTQLNVSSASSADSIGWHNIDWPIVYRTVRKLQIRIAKATRESNWRKVSSLQRYLTRSFCGKVLAIRRVTENRGKKTPGVDGETWSTPEDKIRAVRLLNRRGYSPRPLRRIHIPKSNGKKRPLGIPTMRDRAMQALHLLALEPVSESLADFNSYGFRPKRSCADAIEQCFNVLSQKQSAKWVLEADIQGCFDFISHEWMNAHIPMDKVILNKWLKAGYVENGRLFPTIAGTPQGGIISPLLANMTLDGLEAALETKFGKKRSQKAFKNKVNLVRYADDFIITGDSKELLNNEVKPLVEEFLSTRGLKFSSEKTRVTHIEEGFDFLGQNVRKYNGKLIIKPSKKNVKAFMDKVREIVKGNKAAKQVSLIRQLNPVITGWANYHKHVCAKETFNKADSDIKYLIWQWARRRHPNKGAYWVKKKYFESVKNRNWVFSAHIGKKDEDGNPIKITLVEAADTPIKRHTKIKGEAIPYDPEQEAYFEQRLKRRMLGNLKGCRMVANLWSEQEGKCLICGQSLSDEKIWDTHHIIRETDGGPFKAYNLVLLHLNCHRQVHALGLKVEKPASVK